MFFVFLFSKKKKKIFNQIDLNVNGKNGEVKISKEPNYLIHSQHFTLNTDMIDIDIQAVDSKYFSFLF